MTNESLDAWTNGVGIVALIFFCSAFSAFVLGWSLSDSTESRESWWLPLLMVVGLPFVLVKWCVDAITGDESGKMFGVLILTAAIIIGGVACAMVGERIHRREASPWYRQADGDDYYNR